MSGASWRDDLIERFAARANPQLRRATSPGLAQLAGTLLYEPTGDDVDVPDLVRFAISFRNEEAGDDQPERERRARRAAGGAFLLASRHPTAADITLIAKGNGVKFGGDLTSKVARDTWAYMVYKRAMFDDRRSF